MFKRPVSKIAAYILGTLAIDLPLTGLLIVWSAWPAMYAVWIITVTAGIVTLMINGLDDYLETRARMEISENEAQKLRPNGADEQ